MNHKHSQTLEQVAVMLETIERQGEAIVSLSPDMRRLLVQATLLARRAADDYFMGRV